MVGVVIVGLRLGVSFVGEGFVLVLKFVFVGDFVGMLSMGCESWEGVFDICGGDFGC